MMREKRLGVAIGSRIKFVRLLNKMTQKDISEKVGVTFQQFRKYETGENKISASRLAMLANYFGMHISFFCREENLNPLMAESNFSEVLKRLRNNYNSSDSNTESTKSQEETDKDIEERMSNLINAVMGVESDGKETKTKPTQGQSAESAEINESWSKIEHDGIKNALAALTSALADVTKSNK